MPLLFLFLAGLAVGEARVVAFGREVSSADAGVVLSAISEGYAAKHGLLPSEEELAPLRKKLGEQGRLVDFPYRIVLSYKLNRVWWPKHGGRLVLSAFGVHLATDAMLREVEGMERTGDVKFGSGEARRKFFEFYEGYRGDGVLTGEKARRNLMDFPAK